MVNWSLKIDLLLAHGSRANKMAMVLPAVPLSVRRMAGLQDIQPQPSQPRYPQSQQVSPLAPQSNNSRVMRGIGCVFPTDRLPFRNYHSRKFISVQSLHHVWLFATPWTAAPQASLSITSSRSSLKLIPIELVMPLNHLILCRPLLLLPSIFPSIRVFSNESALPIRWPKDWTFSLNISPSNEHQGLFSFRMDWLDLLAVQGTLKSLLQHHSSKASILWHSAFFIVQLSHPYMTTGKTIALTWGIQKWLPVCISQSSPKKQKQQKSHMCVKRFFKMNWLMQLWRLEVWNL